MKKSLLGITIVVSLSLFCTSVFAFGNNKTVSPIIITSSQSDINILPITTGAVIELTPISPTQFGIDETKLKNMKPDEAQKYIQEKMDTYTRIHFGSGIQSLTVTAGIFTGAIDTSFSGAVQVLPHNSTGGVIVSVSQGRIIDSGIILVGTGTVQISHQVPKKLKKRIYIPRER